MSLASYLYSTLPKMRTGSIWDCPRKGETNEAKELNTFGLLTGGRRTGAREIPKSHSCESLPVVPACFHTTIVLISKGQIKTIWYKVYELLYLSGT